MAEIIITLLSITTVLSICLLGAFAKQDELKARISELEVEPEYEDSVEYWKDAFDNRGILLRELEERPCSCCGRSYEDDVNDAVIAEEPIAEWDGVCPFRTIRELEGQLEHTEKLLEDALAVPDFDLMRACADKKVSSCLSTNLDTIGGSEFTKYKDDIVRAVALALEGQYDYH